MKYSIAMIVLLIASMSFANENQIIIKTKQGTTIEALGFQRSTVAMNPLIQNMGIQLLQFNGPMDASKIVKQLRSHPDVIYAQLDHEVTLRAQPDDENFDDQWNMHYENKKYGIDAVKTWDAFGTGGKDVAGNDIVVAVVDGGMGLKHPDLIENVWKNEGEIPGNNKDDDGNGYIDDVYGWSAYTNDSTIEDDYHGSHVAGIIGAQGNNGLQVTGVNWDIKLMAVPGATGSTSTVLVAYNYVLDQKKLWLATDGKQGANIVATNSSFGVDGADCESGDYPAWNDIYDEMGEAGILSAAATANANFNIDKKGDVPTGCSSDYLITVTNNNSKGKKSQYAGYGATTIDLAAPGEQIFSTVSNGGTSFLSGTSMATPHVAGAVGYLHSVASKDLNEMFVEDPGAAALALKDIILSSVNKTNELKTKTVSGGILNLYGSSVMASEFSANE